jgi:hypothetical protein
MRLFSYVVAQDYGFAPNPFHGLCTLATCKPRIRQIAARGDYIVGTGSARRRRRGYVVYFMRVTDIAKFDVYWSDERFASKRPNLHSSKMNAFGDNIYHRDPVGGLWLQENSYHSNQNGSANRRNVEHDTKSENVLISSDFVYWGGTGPVVPERFRSYDGVDVCFGRGHRSNWPSEMASEFVSWVCSLNQQGYVGKPLDWSRTA